MPDYIVNKKAQSKGDHEVHVTPQAPNCRNYPALANRESLGFHATCHGAVQEANHRGYGPANGCYYCANDCHTG